MSEIKLSVLHEIEDLRTVWPNEAADFTPWLAQPEHIALLSSAIGIDINVEETESPVGGFSADILGSVPDIERKIIIENQLEESDHDHLGKIITYAAGKEANYVVWIVKHARDEHKAAIEWLNANMADDIGFFLLEIKLYKIGNALPAPKFVVVEEPNDWAKASRGAGNGISKNEEDRLAYWTAFNEFAFDEPSSEFVHAFKRHKPTCYHWYVLNIGTSQAHLSLLREKKHMSVGVELYIRDDKEMYDKLNKHKGNIEKETGMKFDWHPLNEKKASRIVVEKTFPIEDKKDWENEFSWLMDTALKMKKAFSKFI